ncbi:hypothetical protein [Intestinibacillus massiliensis]|uniref:hypothetical protein n=1 Tax=Intestinibacillus massiliensis TaxID=1871029 RepID=UPI000B36343A|nr:hypothetical protein [Intestinibacillus massiliensis]
MSQREDWWDYTKKIIRSYPRLKRKLQGTGSPVERAVVDRLTDKEQRRYDAVAAAIRETEGMKNGAHRLELVRRVYWDRTHTVEGAALQVPTSAATAYRWNNQFVRLVSKKLDLP